MHQDIIKFPLSDKLKNDVMLFSTSYCIDKEQGKYEFARQGFYRAKDKTYDFSVLFEFINLEIQTSGFVLSGIEDMCIIITWPGQSYCTHQDSMFVVHVPMITSPLCQMIIEDNLYYLEPGYFYITNTKKSHSAFNLSTHPRSHIMFAAEENS